MRRYAYIAIGGVLGAMARFFIKNIHLINYKGSFPLNTFTINITGSFILAFLLTTSGLAKFDEDIKLGIGTGFLGAYTTFSSMCKEAVTLMRNGSFNVAILYLLLSVVIGFLAAYFGFITSSIVLQKLVRREEPVVLNEIVISKEEEN